MLFWVRAPLHTSHASSLPACQSDAGSDAVLGPCSPAHEPCKLTASLPIGCWVGCCSGSVLPCTRAMQAHCQPANRMLGRMLFWVRAPLHTSHASSLPACQSDAGSDAVLGPCSPAHEPCKLTASL